MSFAETRSRGARLKARLGVNGIHSGSSAAASSSRAISAVVTSGMAIEGQSSVKRPAREDALNYFTTEDAEGTEDTENDHGGRRSDRRPPLNGSVSSVSSVVKPSFVSYE